MLLRHRIQDWLADRISWVQYPNIRDVPTYDRAPSASQRFAHMSYRQRYWLYFWVFWGLVVAVSFLGPF
jgi:hypothetical protein